MKTFLAWTRPLLELFLLPPGRSPSPSRPCDHVGRARVGARHTRSSATSTDENLFFFPNVVLTSAGNGETIGFKLSGKPKCVVKMIDSEETTCRKQSEVRSRWQPSEIRYGRSTSWSARPCPAARLFPAFSQLCGWAGSPFLSVAWQQTKQDRFESIAKRQARFCAAFEFLVAFYWSFGLSRWTPTGPTQHRRLSLEPISRERANC